MHTNLANSNTAKTLAILAWLLPVACSRLALGDDWAQFLGPNRNGVSAETGLLDAWPDGGPKVVWRKPGGVGMSAVVVVGGQAITTVQGENQSVVSLDAATGKRNWLTEIAPAYKNAQGDGPRSTPAVKDGRVFVLTGEGILAALSLSDGTILWKKEALKDSGGRVAEFGMACSPLVVGKRVIGTLGGRRGSTVAFDAESGKTLWSSGSDPAGYSSPALVKIGGKDFAAVFNGKGLVGLNPADGAPQWKYSFPTDFDCNIATPLAYKNQVFISAGENHGSVMVRPVKQGSEYSTDESWTSLGVSSILRSGWQTGIVDGNHLYSFDNVGAAGPIMHLTCIDLDSGKRVWQKTRFGKGNLVAADGKLFISTMKGELVIAKINSNEYEELGRGKYFRMTRQAPTLSDGRLYIRDDHEIICIDVRRAQ